VRVLLQRAGQLRSGHGLGLTHTHTHTHTSTHTHTHRGQEQRSGAEGRGQSETPGAARQPRAQGRAGGAEQCRCSGRTRISVAPPSMKLRMSSSSALPVTPTTGSSSPPSRIRRVAVTPSITGIELSCGGRGKGRARGQRAGEENDRVTETNSKRRRVSGGQGAYSHSSLVGGLLPAAGVARRCFSP